MRRSFVAGTALAALLALAPGCGGDGSIPDGLEREVLVSAASSLTDAFTAVEAAFEAAHPGVDVVVNFGASSTLREQILRGAPVDVFASASEAIIQQVATAGRAGGDPVVFAQNLLRIAVPAGNPGGVVGIEDFDRVDLVIGLCAEPVPCGALARAALADAGVIPAVDTNEPNVRALLTKIELGEIDAGIVYATDVLSAGDRVESLPVPGEVRAPYSLVVLAGAPHPESAAAFVAFVLSDEGRAILGEYGFITP